MDETNEFSFTLKPSKFGVGVFAAHPIAKGTYLRLFGDSTIKAHTFRELQKAEVPEEFQDFCLDRGEALICPPDFGVMPLGWYMNHSVDFNAEPGLGIHSNKKYRWYAIRDIAAGEEILIDYKKLEEPEESRAAYYAQ
jgi:SET domain-containing protein